jgi:hypothetical protein
MRIYGKRINARGRPKVSRIAAALPVMDRDVVTCPLWCPRDLYCHNRLISEVCESGLDQAQNDGKNHRSRDAEHHGSICRLEWSQ